MINCINNLNNRSKAKSMFCFDFLTLYITAPHDNLLKVLFQIIDFCLFQKWFKNKMKDGDDK